MRLEARVILGHAGKHLLVDLVHGGGGQHTAHLLHGAQHGPRGPRAPQGPLAEVQGLGQVLARVGPLPQVQQLQGVLRRGAGAGQGRHGLQGHPGPGQAVGEQPEVLQADVLQAAAARHLPLTEVHAWGTEGRRDGASGWV